MTGTCVIMGNGPSLMEMPKSYLSDYPTYGVNWCPYTPTYYVCVDSHILLEHTDDVRDRIRRADVSYLPEFLRYDLRLHDLYDSSYVRTVSKDTKDFKEEDFFSGFTVSYVCLKLAYYAGFNEVHLWGVDHSPGWEHYDPSYHALTSDAARHRHNMRVMERHYGLAQRVYKRAGRRILNFSLPSKLDGIFERGEI